VAKIVFQKTIFDGGREHNEFLSPRLLLRKIQPPRQRGPFLHISIFAKYEQIVTFFLRFTVVYSMINKTMNRGSLYEDQDKGHGLR